MRYVHAVQGAFIAFILFSIAAFVIPGAGPSSEVEIILTISTFLFAILAGFFISRLSSRYNSMRERLGAEDAYFVSLYKTAQIYGEAFAKKIADLIDKYYIVSYDFIYSKSYKETDKYVLRMWNELKKLKKHKSESTYESLVNDLTEIERGRKIGTALYEETIGPGQWTVLVFLSCIILFSIFYLKTGTIYSQIITLMLSTVLVLVLLIIRDLHNFMLGGQGLLEESGEEVLDSIGKPRYYNQLYVKRGISKIPKSLKAYRLGMHEPGSDDFDIRLVRQEPRK